MNHPEEITKTSPNCIIKWVLKERQHSPHAQLLLVLEQIKSSSPSMGCSRVLKLQNLLMQTSLTIFLQTKVRGAARIIISWAFKNSSNITPRLLPLTGNSNIDNTCFSCHPWRFFLFFLVFRSKIPCNKGQTKNSCTSPFMSLDISGYHIIICKLSSPKSLSIIKWGYR